MRRLFPLFALLLAPVYAHPANYSYVDLVHRLTDLKYLATLPAPGDTCAQWSSPGGTGSRRCSVEADIAPFPRQYPPAPAPNKPS